MNPVRSLERIQTLPIAGWRKRDNEIAMMKTGNDEKLLLPEQAIALLRTQLDIPVEGFRYDDPGVDGWERITLKIVERTFGEHTRNANHFSCSVSYTQDTQEEAQEAHFPDYVCTF